MKANSINALARDIRSNRAKFENIVNDFKAYWGKVYRKELTEALNKVTESLKGDKENESLKNERYGLEQICAKTKGLTLSDDIRTIITEIHDEDGLTFDRLTAGYIIDGLTGTPYVNEAGELCEKKKVKGTDKVEWKPIERWTEAKVGRYFRLATIGVNIKK